MNTMSASQIKADFGVNVGDMIGNVIMIRLSPDVRLTIIHSIANPDQFLVLKDVTVDNPNVALESMEPMDLKIFRVDEEGNDIAIQVEVIIDALSDPYGVGDDSHTEYQVDVVSAVDPEGNSVILTNEENDEVYEKAVGKYFRTWHESANNITTNDLSISAATVKDGHNRPTKDNDIQGVLKPDQGGYHTESAIESRLTDIQDPNIVDVSEIYESVSTVDDKDLMMVSLGAYNYSDKALDATYDFESYVDALEQLAQETYDQEQKEALFAWYRKSMPVLDDDIKYLSKLVGKDMKEAANINIVKKDKTMQNIKTEGTNACKEFSESKSVVYALASNRGTWVNIDDRDVGYFSKAEAGQLASDLGGIAQDVDGGQKKFRVVKEAKIKQFALNTGEEDIATWTRELKYRYPNAEIVPNNFNGKDAFVNGDHVGYTRRNNSGTWQLWVAAAYKTKAEDDKKTEATGDNYKVPVGVGPIGNFVVDKVLGDENGIKLISFAEGTSNEGSYAVMDDKDNLIAVGMEINLINVISTHSSFEDALLRFQNEVARESKERGIDIMFPTVGLQVDDPSTLSPEMTGLDESSNDVFINKIMPALIRAQAVSKAEDLVKHVNRDDDGNYWTSDWYDSDATVASFSNGRQINNEEGIPEYFGNNWYYEGEVIANTNTKEELESKDLHVGLVDTIGGNTSKVWRVPQNDLKQVRESSYTSPFERAGLRVHMDPDKNTATVLINSEHDMNKFVQVYDEFSSQGGFGALEVKVNDDPDELHLYSVTFPMAHPGPEVKPDDSAMKELPISEAFHQLRNKHVN